MEKGGHQKGKLGARRVQAQFHLGHGLRQQLRRQVIHGPLQGVFTGREYRQAQQDRALAGGRQRPEGLSHCVPEHDGILAIQLQSLSGTL